jgi:hypothetical protein
MAIQGRTSHFNPARRSPEARVRCGLGQCRAEASLGPGTSLARQRMQDMASILRHPRADMAWANRRVHELERRVACLAFRDLAGVDPGTALRDLQQAIEHRERVAEEDRLEALSGFAFWTPRPPLRPFAFK